MRSFVVFLILVGFVVFLPHAFASCISLPCDDASKNLGEPNYRFIDFSYQNKVGEPIRFVLEKTAYDHCNSFIATITNEKEEMIWEQKDASLCVIADNQDLMTSQIKLGYFAHNPIIINESGKYLLKVQIDDGSIQREFVARENYSGGSLDRTSNPVPWYSSPLKQFESGFEFNEIKCRENLVLVQKYDGSPACVTYQTGSDLVNRGWATCDDGVIHGRGHPCGPRSSTGIVEFDTASYKPVYPKFDGVTEIINPEHESLEYLPTNPVIDDTYLSKNVQQWTNSEEFELQAEYEKYGDEFYIELGRLLMKNEMQNQMNDLGIVNSDEDFKVVSGMMLLSLPPHIGFSSIVHGTDGHYYWLEGMAYANQVNYYRTTQLQYPDIVEVDFDKKTQDGLPRISILPKGTFDMKSLPTLPVLSQPGKIEFYNDTPRTVTIFLNKEGKDEFSFETSQQFSVKTNTGKTWDFTEPGSYHWEAEAPIQIDGKNYELNTGGGLLVLADDMSNLSKEEQMETARMMLISSGLPIGGMGQKGEDDTLYISFSPAIHEILPESKQYYLKRAQNLIPFDISIKLDEPDLEKLPPQESTPDSGSLFVPDGSILGDAHEHASILVKIFGDKFDFSHRDFQIKSSWIHFEGLDGNTIHRHSKGITLGYLFETLNLKLTSDCFVFASGREFCTDQDYSLKFYINERQFDDIRDYVVSEGDRILISYGSEDMKEIQEQLDELNSQEIIN